jgi:hypothetical protein
MPGCSVACITASWSSSSHVMKVSSTVPGEGNSVAGTDPYAAMCAL